MHDRGTANLSSGEDSLPGLHMATFLLLFLYMAFFCVTLENETE